MKFGPTSASNFNDFYIGGKLGRHFLVESCPLYHNLSKKACRDFQVIVLKEFEIS
jgi:hypothetical protein